MGDADADLREAQAGDPDAAGRLLDAHKGLLVKLCRTKLAPGVELDDLLQEARIAGLDAIRWFKPGRYDPTLGTTLQSYFTSYLKVCVLNRLGRYLKPRKKLVTLVQPDEPGDDRLTAEGLNAVAAAAGRPDTWLPDALGLLTRAERVALGLKYGLDGGGPLGPVAVAKRMKVRQRTAAWLIFTAEEKLKAAAAGHEYP